MAAVTRSNVSLATKSPPDTARLGPYPAGADLTAGDACYVASDGKVYPSTAAAANAAAEVHGFSPGGVTAAQRQPVTLYHDVTLNYGSGLTPGTYLYLSAVTAGGLDTVSGANQTKPVGLVLPDGKRVRVKGTF